jgi:hypothetical protein
MLVYVHDSARFFDINFRFEMSLQEGIVRSWEQDGQVTVDLYSVNDVNANGHYVTGRYSTPTHNYTDGSNSKDCRRASNKILLPT